MPVNEVAENVLGTIGTVLWSGQLIPQVWKSYHEKSTDGLSPWLMFIWATSGLFLGVYNIVSNLNIPLIIQPQLFSSLAALSWVQCLYYGQGRSWKVCTIIFITYLGTFGGFEAAMAMITREAILEEANRRPVQFFGVFSGVLVCVGLIPQLFEIFQRREVKGISLIFMAIDIMGAVFSTLSLAFRETFDGIAAATYLGVIALDSSIVAAYFIMNPRAEKRLQTTGLADLEKAQEWPRRHTVQDTDDPLENSSRKVLSSAAHDILGEAKVSGPIISVPGVEDRATTCVRAPSAAAPCPETLGSIMGTGPTLDATPEQSIDTNSCSDDQGTHKGHETTSYDSPYET